VNPVPPALPPFVPILATLLLGGVAALDATAVAQTMLAQPLVTATLLGLVWGQPLLAAKVGIVLQLFSAGTMPVGARTPEDYGTGGVIGAGTAMLLAATTSFSVAHEASAFAGCIVGLVAATAGVPLVKWQRRRNEGLSRWCESAVRAGDLAAPAKANGAGVVMAFGIGVLFCAVFLALSTVLVTPFVRHRSISLARAWGLAQPLWLGLGLAHLLAAFVQRRFMRAALFGVGLVVGWILLLVEA
jgi:mannose/fructose/N-acetylgalactosamine-specific phosphotransferase system component IIC